MTTDLHISNLSISFASARGRAEVIDGASLDIPAGRIVGLVGESGSGKTVLAKAILGILAPTARIDSGSIRFGDRTIVENGVKTRVDVRGKHVAMIFQNPKSSLNPIRKIGRQIEDVVRRHTGAGARQAKVAAIQALASVHLPDPARIYHSYPFELSGGMAQRALIAVALACKPSLLIADEPTTGLDVSLQSEIMDLIQTISRERQMSVLLITHDLAVAEGYCDAIAVMHAGHVVETAPAVSLLDTPHHPYTTALTRSMPSAIERLSDLRPISGTLPDLYADVTACRFLQRCERREKICEAPERLAPSTIAENHTVLCRRPL